MKREITTERIPIKLWLENIEEGALDQARNIANLPFAFHHVAIMPDAHEGFGMPIGGVLATQDVVVPNAVGVDIGCGMCAQKTSLREMDNKMLKKIMSGIRSRIPLGFKHHKQPRDLKLMPAEENIVDNGIVEQEYDSALYQLGTLGSGNHFIEIQVGSDGHIWLMVHSGSRNIGYRVADHYNKLAKQLNAKMHPEEDLRKDLAWLPLETEQAQRYLSEMQYCIDFAFANRKLMMDYIIDAFHEELKGKFQLQDFINIAHNYAAFENHFGEEVVVHRKGATRAMAGETGIIPGSQGTKSYIVKGKGNPESFTSCSHGAGRIMGRRHAQRTLDLKEEIARLDNQGIIHAIRHKRDLDEAPSAYKNIHRVMQDQEDLVEVLVELRPLAVVKG